MTSDKQLRANRSNGKKGKGPVSEKGKVTSSFNALKHGILSNQLFIFTGGDITDYESFSDFMECFFKEMQPVGMMETLLVDRLFATFWRLRRLHIAETGFIQKQVEPHSVERVIENIAAQGVARKDVENGFFRQMRTSTGCSHLAVSWQTVADSIQEKGLPLSVGMTRLLDEEFGGNSGFWKAANVSIYNWIVQNKGGAKPMNAEEEKRFNEIALDYAKQLSEMFKMLSDVLAIHEEETSKADVQSKMIPSPAELDKIQRYDAHLQRVLLQTLHELQRMQAARLGKPAPMAAALDVTLNSENGFVS
ncbi:MAG: hypothetical protein PHZ00_01260 [Candidatus Peribacteraceae bacterium]|nr:hypothetical protein [Candidatus Peribacteraceae bacterium]